jgi:hypothetical protein
MIEQQDGEQGRNGSVTERSGKRRRKAPPGAKPGAARQPWTLRVNAVEHVADEGPDRHVTAVLWVPPGGPPEVVTHTVTVVVPPEVCAAVGNPYGHPVCHSGPYVVFHHDVDRAAAAVCERLGLPADEETVWRVRSAMDDVFQLTMTREVFGK